MTNSLPLIRIPVEALKKHTAIMGTTGKGKTYLAKGAIVEPLLAMGKRVCILDPTGAYWGLKSSADGKKAGFPITIFGGDHADVPINEHAGAALGELLAKENMPAVIDLSDTTLSARHRFVERFAESIFRANKTPIHLIIDEADEFAPQSGLPGTERMLGAIDRIVRRGRIKGFRVTLITQRPAVLNKNVLTQATTIVALGLPGKQDRNAIEGWIKGQADEGQAGEVMKSLASLPRGEGWLWSPENGILQRGKSPTILTFDSSATPEDGEVIAQPKVLAEVDLSGIQAALAEAVKESQANDPALLRKRIAELEKQNASAPSASVDEGHRVQIKVLNDRCNAHAAAIEMYREKIVRLTGQLDQAKLWFERVSREADHHLTLNGHAEEIRSAAVDHEPRRGLSDIPLNELTSYKIPLQASQSERPASPSHDGVSKPQQRLLDAISWWRAAGVERPMRVQVAAIAQYAPTSGTWSNLISSCRTSGWIEVDQDRLMLTNAGRHVANAMSPCADEEELHRRIREKLSNPQRRLFDVVLTAGGNEIPRTHAAELAGYVASSGTFSNLVSSLRTLGLIHVRKTTLSAASWLFSVGVAR